MRQNGRRLIGIAREKQKKSGTKENGASFDAPFSPASWPNQVQVITPPTIAQVFAVCP
jgi:hypothetical protein